MKGSSSAARWVVVAEKVAAREMPPKDGMPLQDSEIRAITDWIAAEMKRSGKHLAKRVAYDNATKFRISCCLTHRTRPNSTLRRVYAP